MKAILYTSLQDLAQSWRTSLVMSLFLGIITLLYLTLNGFQAGLHAQIELDPLASYLIVHETDINAEQYGSRIPGDTHQFLMTLGISQAIPEIHHVAGTSIQNAVHLRGIDPASYQRLDSFRLLSGKAIVPGDPERSVMLGMRLAEKWKKTVGDTVSLRGRDFQVVGIFQTGAFADNQAWIMLSAAQALLGWGEDVSLYVIPAGEGLQPGDQPAPGLTVQPRGAAIRRAGLLLDPHIYLIQWSIQIIGIAAAFALTNILLRLAWLRRRQLAILRCLGFASWTAAVYLLIQAFAIALPGITFGVACAWLLSLTMKVYTFDFTIAPIISPALLVTGLAWSLGLSLAGAILPAWWLGRLHPAKLLRNE